MLAFEALTHTPKAATLANSGDDAAKSQGVSFEEFLKGVAKHSILLTPKGNVVLPAQEKTDGIQTADDPKAMLLTLLQNDDDVKEANQEESLLELLKNDNADTPKEFTLNPALSKELSVNELKYLLHKAKQYLKTRILQADPQLTKKQLPKSLKGLLRLADKLKIEITKISFEQIVSTEESLQQKPPKIASTLTNSASPAKKEHPKKASVATKVEHEVEMIDEGSMKLKTIETKIENIKETPLFQAKSRTVNVRHILTTSQIIENKSKKELAKKDQAPDLLHTLLKGKGNKAAETAKESLFGTLQSKMEKTAQHMDAASKESLENPKRHEEFSKSLEELLRSDTASHEVKHQAHKSADALDVKIHEAKQMMKYLSQDIKKAIEEYKPPFSRVKVKLNPQRLGEMDLTVVQRGKNVHINLSSNNAALNVLTNNLHELRTQLNQSGINNATFNFNSDAQNQQQKQKEQDRRQEYEYFANEEENEERSRSLEIIVPRYI